MYEGKRIISLIPARGGSKGIKDKNIIMLKDRPLIAYSIGASLESKYVDTTVVTTDSDRIAKVSKQYGADVPFMRPKELATDEARTIDAVLHALSFLKNRGEVYDVLVLLQPTEPLRTAEDIDGAIEFFFFKEMKGLVSVSLVDDHPLLIRTVDEEGNLKSLLGRCSEKRRQDMDSYYRVNGCIYINRIDELDRRTSLNDNPIGYIMDASHSVDIDEMKDVYMAEYYLKREERDQ